ncbi:MAG: chemotaxis protein CheW [Cyanobacteriota bacterium]
MENHYLTTETLDTNYNLYMTFSLAERLYAAPAQSIVEVIKLPMLNCPEHLPEHIVGILNLRGNIINVLDIRRTLGLEPKTYTTDDCILVLTYEDASWGLIVDAVSNVVTISNDQISQTPYGIDSSNTLIKNVAKTAEGLLAILNLQILSRIMKSSEQNLIGTDEKKQSYIPAALKYTVNQISQFPKDKKAIEIFKKRATELQLELDLSLERKKTSDHRFVSFLLNNEMYAISLEYIREFSKIINLAIVPCVPEFYKGLSNLRGEFIPVLDIKGFLGISKTQITEKSKIIFVKTSKMQIGILVDEVFDIIIVPTDKITKPGLMQIDKVKYTTGEIIFDDKRVINIFDLEKFLQDERLIIEEAV